MYKNIHFDNRKNKIHLWEEINGENFYDEIDFVPYVFLPSTEEDSDAKTIFGDNVRKKIFKSYYQYSDFQKNNKDNLNIFENNVKSEIQFLAERYHGIPDEEMYVPNLLCYYVDIETLPGEGFPNWKNPKDPIVLISARNGKTKKTVTFGYDPYGDRKYTGNRKDVKYISCESEEVLLRKFFAFMHKFPCDIFSGFNISGVYGAFDIPYIINRTKFLFGEEVGIKLYSRMSPINKVNVWKQKTSDDLNIDIAGMTILDYIDLYKKYGKNLERNTLDYICQVELGKGKLKNSYSSFKEQIEKDWNEFVEYNVVDCERVNDLEDKLAYIRMIQTLCLFCKVPMKYYNVQNQLIEGLMLVFYRRNGLCAPHFKGGEKIPFEAGYCKDPQIGMYEWIVDVDITSSYPSHIITLNMSHETFFGRIIRMQENEIVSYVRKREFPSFKMLKEKSDGEFELINLNGNKLRKFNIALRKGLFTISPGGTIFRTNVIGVVPIVEKYMFFKRKEVKKSRDEFGLKAKECDGVDEIKYKERERELDSLQNAIKIMMNAFFGIMTVPYSRYYNIHIGEAITSCARHTIKSGEKFCNDLLNGDINLTINNKSNFPETFDNLLKYLKSDWKMNDVSKDYIGYIDTDSLFVELGEWLNDIKSSLWKNINKNDEKIELIRKISAIVEKYIDNRIYDEVQLQDYNSQVNDFKIGFKQEIIARTALFIKKKKYAYWLVNKEGNPKNEIKVKGLEIIRSESAEAIRPILKTIMEMIMRQKSDNDISTAIRKYKKEISKLEPSLLAANIGVKGIKKYLGSGIPKKGTPWHVKGVYGYRFLLDHLNIKNKYEDIKEGLKAKVVYVKSNPFNIETVTFYEWPEEFNDVIQLDSEKMIEKFFINKVRFLLKPIDKEHILTENKRGLNLFFGV